MTAETTLAALVRMNLAASVAIVLVIALRPLVLRWLGGSVAYWFWLVVPAAAAASMLPAGEVCVQALVWPISDGRQAARAVNWCFNVT